MLETDVVSSVASKERINLTLCVDLSCGKDVKLDWNGKSCLFMIG